MGYMLQASEAPQTVSGLSDSLELGEAQGGRCEDLFRLRQIG
jgi:hypothetical protein